MLIRLLRDRLRPYQGPLALLVALQFLQTCATLYLPTLNADIIDNGVVQGDTGYILGHGGLMIGISLAQVVCNVGAVCYGARTRRPWDGPCAPRCSTGCARTCRRSVFGRAVAVVLRRELGQLSARRR
ncbi:ATP-binding cassette subfamily B protein OS=Streptomyces albaduncus OX=68172 GN=FHS32_000525 PE=4 SV=1 [Streptomyces griseoloalbus]